MGRFDPTISMRSVGAPPSRRWTMMKTVSIGWIVMVLTGLTTEATAARQIWRDRPVPRATRQPPSWGPPRVPILRPTPDDGIIRWNTPNKDGNLGGSGTGGSGGGGG